LPPPVPQAAGARRYGSDLQEKATMIGSISGANALLSQLLNPGASSTNSNAVSGSSGVSASGSTATQDLQSFMSALIKELRQSGAAATSTAGTAATAGSAAGAGTGAASGGASVAQAGTRHGHGHGGHGHGGQSQVSNQLESLLQQLGSPTATASATGSITGLPSANSGSQSASNLQASFQRLMQDVSSTQKPREVMHATA
jgi:hypothetical protein